MNDPQPTLIVRDLHVTYANAVQALRGVSIDLYAGEVLAVVGESGCGKSTLALTVQGLLPASARVTGHIALEGATISGQAGQRVLRSIRGRRIGFLAQEPSGSFNPVWRVGSHIAEARRLGAPLAANGALRDWVAARLTALRIGDAGQRARQFPHQWSGGMLQRGALAAANANDPSVLIVDEPTASLDAPLAVYVLDQLREEISRGRQAVLLITHHLGMALHIADRIAVMYAGRIVETGEAPLVLGYPQHPYTRALMAAMPRFSAVLPEPLDGEPPSLAPPPAGCAFAPRCPLARPECATGLPPELVNGVACPVVMTTEESKPGNGDV